RLHNTVVVAFRPDGSIVLSSGGWHTVTSKDRINRVIRARGWNLASVKREWTMTGPWGNRFPYADGFTIDANGFMGEPVACADCGALYDDTGKAGRGLPPLCGRCFTSRLARGVA